LAEDLSCLIATDCRRIGLRRRRAQTGTRTRHRAGLRGDAVTLLDDRFPVVVANHVRLNAWALLTSTPSEIEHLACSNASRARSIGSGSVCPALQRLKAQLLTEPINLRAQRFILSRRAASPTLGQELLPPSMERLDRIKDLVALTQSTANRHSQKDLSLPSIEAPPSRPIAERLVVNRLILSVASQGDPP
jgi:hypothetical protein